MKLLLHNRYLWVAMLFSLFGFITAGLLMVDSHNHIDHQIEHTESFMRK